jgi:hypothetical protein
MHSLCGVGVTDVVCAVCKGDFNCEILCSHVIHNFDIKYNNFSKTDNT